HAVGPSARWGTSRHGSHAAVSRNAVLRASSGSRGPESPPAEFLGTWPVPRLPLLALSTAFLLTAAWLPWRLVPQRADGPTA
ncbi:MAG: hypothetical protein AAGF47_00710, partial [Planctomycetota bacterium]